MEDLNDRERILMALVSQLASTFILAPGVRGYHQRDFGDYTHFARYRQPQPGDLVLATTGGISRWKVGWYVEALTDGAMIREIGSGAVCEYRNESFVPVVGLSKSELLEGEQRTMYQKVLQAFRRGDEYLYRFGGIDFEGDVAVIWIREAFGGLGRPSTPFCARLPFSKRTSVKTILKAMRDAGYGTRSFRPAATETQEA